MSDDRENLFELGEQYFSGQGRPKDLQHALECFRRSAELGYAPAQHELGLAYDPVGRASTYGSPGNSDVAFQWYLKSAEQGNRKAMMLVAMAYRLGSKVAPDRDKSAEWYTKLVPFGETHAMTQLGLIALEREQMEKGAEWLKSAAELGDPYALALYRDYVEGGLFPALDPSIELLLLESAAKKGDRPAMVALGLKYEKGEGVRADLPKAFALFSFVACYEEAKGRPGGATDGVERIKGKLSADELTIADKLMNVMPKKLSLD